MLQKYLICLSLLTLSCLGQALDINTLSGMVLNQAGLPEAGVSVYLEGPGGPHVTVSDLQGAYAFKQLEDGIYILKAWSQSHSSLPNAVMVFRDQEQTSQVTLDQSEVELPARLKIQPLKDGRANLAEGRELSLSLKQSEKTHPLSAPEVTQALQALETGDYEIVLSAPGLAYVGTVSIRRDGSQATVVHANGMEIGSSYFIQAISEQATLPDAVSSRL